MRLDFTRLVVRVCACVHACVYMRRGGVSDTTATSPKKSPYHLPILWCSDAWRPLRALEPQRVATAAWFAEKFARHVACTALRQILCTHICLCTFSTTHTSTHTHMHRSGVWYTKHPHPYFHTHTYTHAGRDVVHTHTHTNTHTLTCVSRDVRLHV